jgi:hypothetical protein
MRFRSHVPLKGAANIEENVAVCLLIASLVGAGVGALLKKTRHCTTGVRTVDIGKSI